MSLSLIISTYGRSRSLIQTLNSLSHSNFPETKFEIILVDNEGSNETFQVVQKIKDVLPIRYILEQQRGINFAWNRAVTEARGELLLFTADDVFVDKNWLVEIWEGSLRWPNISIFGGKILPKWPKGTQAPNYLPKNFMRGAYAINDQIQKEGECSADSVFGGNLAIRRKVFDDGRSFNTDLGPKGKQYIMGSETEFLLKLVDEGFKAVYFPDAIVYHQIRKEQLEPKWMYSRSFKAGRAQKYIDWDPALPKLFNIDRYLYKKLGKSVLRYFIPINLFNKQRRVILIIEIKRLLGEMYQCFQLFRGK